MRELNDLFEAILFDHARKPRNHRRLDQATAISQGNNPFCGDRCKVFLNVAGGVIKDVSFEGAGCAILIASASLMTLALVGKTLEQAQVIVKQFHEMLMAEVALDEDNLGDLAALAGVRQYPSRIKCAMLPWRAVREALQKEKSGN